MPESLVKLVDLTAVVTLWTTVVATTAVLVALLWVFQVPWSITAAITAVTLVLGLGWGAFQSKPAPKPGGDGIESPDAASLPGAAREPR